MRHETLFERMSKIARGTDRTARGATVGEVDQLRQPSARRSPREIPMPGREEGK